MKFRPLLKLIFISIVTLGLVSSQNAQAQRQPRSDPSCEIWLCLPGIMPDSLIAGTNILAANCERAFFTYAFRVASPFATALPNYRSCITSEFRNKHPNLTMRTRARRANLPFRRWERYSIEVFENGVKQGEWTFEHRYNRLYLENPNAVRRWRRRRSFANFGVF